MKKLFTALLTAALILLGVCIAHSASKIYRKTSLTGGTSADMDGIDGAGLNDGDITWIFESNVAYLYYLDADLGEAESSPTYIVPDTNPGSKVWVLQGTYGSEITAISGYNLAKMRTISSYSTFALAIAGAGTDYNTLVGSADSGTVTVTTDTTIPATVTFWPQKGFTLTYQDANVDLTINGPVQAGLYQWIDPNRSWVTFGDGSVNEYQAAWWGLSSAASAATNYTALNAAITCANSSGGGAVKIPVGSFDYGTTLSLPADIALIGADGVGRMAGDAPTELNFTGSSGYAMQTTASTAIVGTAIKNIKLVGTANADGGIHLGDDGAIYSCKYHIEDVLIYDFSKASAVGLWIDNPSLVLCNNVYVEGITNGTALDLSANGVNTGVITFNDCSFGGSGTSNGASLRSISNTLDSVTFNSCHFGGTSQPLELGTGGTQVRSILFNACHIETYNGAGCTQLVNIACANNPCSATFNTCFYYGAAVADYAATIAGGTGKRIIYFANSDFTNLDPNGYVLNIATTTATENWVVLDGYIIATTTPGLVTGTGAKEIRIRPTGKYSEFTANDTTPDVASSDTYICSNDHTSNCTITQFDNGHMGKILTIRGNPGGTYYTIIETGGNFRLSADDWNDKSEGDGGTLTLRYDGSYWYEVGRRSKATYKMKTAAGTVGNYENFVAVSTGEDSDTISLQPAAISKGVVLHFVKTDAGAGTLIVDPSGAEHINGDPNNSEMDAQYDAMIIGCNGSEWFIFSKNIAP